MGKQIKITAKKPLSTKKNSSLYEQKTGFHSQSIHVDRILHFKRTISNQIVQRLIRSGALQAKLMVSQPEDKYEQEADRVAEAVIRMRELDLLHQPGKFLQARKPPIQSLEVAQDLETHINLLRGRGQPLPESVRAFFEPRFGYDFSRVRIHTDVQSAELARALNARAFTVGQDVVFGVRQYAPWTILGRRLLAHELVHVIQQTGRGIAFGERPEYLQCSNDKDGFWYIVKSGDYLDGIAKGNGLLSWKDIYYHEKNKVYREKRKDANKLYPGDQLWIPTDRLKIVPPTVTSSPPHLSMNMIPVNYYKNPGQPFSTKFAQKYKRHDGIVMDKDVKGRGSAVLVYGNIVLTAAHVVRQISHIYEATVTFNREIDPITQELSTNRPWGYIKKLLEVADPPLDYALLEIAWHGDRYPGVPAARIDPSGVSMDQPIFGFHHPLGQPTHVSKGTVLIDQISPNVNPPKNVYFTSVDLQCQKGSSGGGIYNSRGKLVGIFHANWTGATEDVVAQLVPLWKGKGVEGTYIMHSAKGIYEYSRLFKAIVDHIPHPDLPVFLFL